MADYDDSNDRYLGEKPAGLLGKQKQSGGMFDWLLKRQGAKAQDKPKPMDNLDEDKLNDVSKSFKSAF